MMSFRLSVVVFALLSLSAQAETLSGRVVAIADGDTRTLLDATNQQHKIRLSGIDAPEKAQDFGQKAKTSLSALAFNQRATADCRKRDRYQREICVVSVGRTDVGLEQVREGMAWWYQPYARDQTPQERADYQQAESWQNYIATGYGTARIQRRLGHGGMGRQWFKLVLRRELSLDKSDNRNIDRATS